MSQNCNLSVSLSRVGTHQLLSCIVTSDNDNRFRNFNLNVFGDFSININSHYQWFLVLETVTVPVGQPRINC